MGRAFLAVSVTDDIRPRPLPLHNRIEVEFRDEDRGQIVGWSSCNSSGSLVQITEQRVILLEEEDELLTTQIGCTDEGKVQDIRLRRFFLTDPYWSLDGDHLTLKSGESVIELEER